jgi:probable DNA repair protein
MPFLPDPLQEALAAGATVVTPNNRLARALTAAFDAAQRKAGRSAWEAALVLPWNAWLTTLWQDAIESGAVDADWRLLGAAQSNYLWRRIVAARAGELIDVAGAARMAGEAWSLVHEWGAGGESWRGWSNRDAAADDDPAAFAAWAERYHAALSDAHAQDGARLADRLVTASSRVAAWGGGVVALAGFTELAPQQTRLVEALASAGMRIDSVATLPLRANRIWRSTHASPRDELACALAWARHVVEADGDAIVALVVPALAERRAEVRALAEDILCPALQWPGQEAAPRPYNLSLGVRLADVDLVAAALDLLALAHGPQPSGRIAAWLRSPYLPGDRDAVMARSALERRWLEQGRRTLTLTEVIAELQPEDPALAQRLRAVRGAVSTAMATPRVFAEAWRAMLNEVGWPGERGQSSAEFQSRGAWDEALVDFAGIATLAPRLAPGEALSALREELSLRVFQPETLPAPIQIMGLLEAAGTPFDALWVAGLDADTWPRAPMPNPMLPLAWQRERGVPGSSAASELARARALTAQLAAGAPDIVFSFAREPGEARGFASSLLPPGAELTFAGDRAHDGTSRQMFAARPSPECFDDTHAPALPAGTVMRGGAGLVAAQGNCPFQAVAAHRLCADPWPDPLDGFSLIERGNLVHDALARFWSDVRTHAALVALSDDALKATVLRHVEASMRALDPLRKRSLPEAVLALETPRIAALLVLWLAGTERSRPPFAVQTVEQRMEVALGGLLLKLRIDRIDTLADGGALIIDYKTGVLPGSVEWIEPRPRAPQLGLYALGYAATRPKDPLRALAYACLRRGELEVDGLAADAAVWDALRTPAALRDARLTGWAELEAHWRRELEALGAEIRRGVASVTPRNVATTCRQCGRQALCRIGSAALGVGEGADDE